MSMNLIELRKRAPQMLDTVIELIVLEDYARAAEEARELSNYVSSLVKSIEKRVRIKAENEGK